MDKVVDGRAKLLCYKNFGIIHYFSNPTVKDFESYLLAVASLNDRSKYKQLHASLSVKGKSLPMEDLERYAHSWLEEMGYRKQPYLIFGHLDTSNAHVHIVSTGVRVDRTKILSSFDLKRAISAVNKIMGIDPDEEFKREVAPLLSYRFSQLSQFQVLLKTRGYRSNIRDSNLYISKYGQVLLRVNVEKITKIALQQQPPHDRIQAIRGLINSRLEVLDNIPVPVFQNLAGLYKRKLIGFSSKLAIALLKVHQIEMLYTFDKLGITGFLVIDHKRREVIEGSLLMDLKRLISPLTDAPQASRILQR